MMHFKHPRPFLIQTVFLALTLLFLLPVFSGCARRVQVSAKVEVVQKSSTTLIPDPAGLLKAKYGPLDPKVELISLRNSNFVSIEVTEADVRVGAIKANDVAAKLSALFATDPSGVRVVVIDPAVVPPP